MAFVGKKEYMKLLPAFKKSMMYFKDKLFLAPNTQNVFKNNCKWIYWLLPNSFYMKHAPWHIAVLFKNWKYSLGCKYLPTRKISVFDQMDCSTAPLCSSYEQYLVLRNEHVQYWPNITPSSKNKQTKKTPSAFERQENKRKRTKNLPYWCWGVNFIILLSFAFSFAFSIFLSLSTFIWFISHRCRQNILKANLRVSVMFSS